MIPYPDSYHQNIKRISGITLNLADANLLNGYLTERKFLSELRKKLVKQITIKLEEIFLSLYYEGVYDYSKYISEFEKSKEILSGISVQYLKEIKVGLNNKTFGNKRKINLILNF